MIDPKISVIAICGKNRIAASALSYTVSALSAWSLSIPVVACANKEDRGYDTWQPSLKRAAHLLGVEVTAPETLEQTPQVLLISLEYDRIIRTDRFTSPHLYNIHFSKLPKYRGVHTSIWPILNGEQEAGVTLHVMDKGIDTGDIVEQRVFPLPPYLTARQLYELYNDEAFILFKDSLAALMNGSCPRVEQQHDQATYYGRKDLRFDELELDLHKDAEHISRFVRAFTFPEYQLPKLGGRTVKACNVIQSSSSLAPGTELLRTPLSSSFVAGDGRVVEVVWA